MAQDRAAAHRVLREHRLGGLPRLPLEAQRKMRGEGVGLGGVHLDAAIEPGPAPFAAGLPRAAEEIHVIPAQTGAGLLLAAVADARRDLPMLALRHRDA